MTVGGGSRVTETLACHLDHRQSAADRRYISTNSVQREISTGQ